MHSPEQVEYALGMKCRNCWKARSDRKNEIPKNGICRQCTGKKEPAKQTTLEELIKASE